MEAKRGDKVRLKSARNRDERGIIESVQGEHLVVQIEVTGEVVHVGPGEVTNFSLAARKAWNRMPDRRVGRPKGTAKTDRVSVTLRIDRDLWEEFKLAEESGVIQDRTMAINKWISEKLAELTDDGTRDRSGHEGGK